VAADFISRRAIAPVFGGIQKSAAHLPQKIHCFSSLSKIFPEFWRNPQPNIAMYSGVVYVDQRLPFVRVQKFSHQTSF